jgi:hypothetical protein
VEEVSVNTAIETLNAREEEGEGNRGRMDQHKDDNIGGEDEEGQAQKGVCYVTVLNSYTS